MTARVTKKHYLLGASALVLLGLGIGGMTYSSHEADASQPAAMPAPAPVATIEVMKPDAVQVWKEFSGRLRAVDFVEMRPQVSGTIQEIRFEDGQIVNKGDILLVIDPARMKQPKLRLLLICNPQKTSSLSLKKKWFARKI